MPSGTRRTLVVMPRPTTIHVCSECGHESAKWHGQCPGCDAWNALVETAVAAAPARGPGAAKAGGARPSVPRTLGDVEAVQVARMKTGIGELDRVLGGGIVPGSLVLIGGSPGIGKSTLTTMALANLAGAGRRVLYVSAE
jgi:DNA repair protein RadA/Sms